MEPKRTENRRKMDIPESRVPLSTVHLYQGRLGSTVQVVVTTPGTGVERGIPWVVSWREFERYDSFIYRDVR